MMGLADIVISVDHFMTQGKISIILCMRKLKEEGDI